VTGGPSVRPRGAGGQPGRRSREVKTGEPGSGGGSEVQAIISCRPNAVKMLRRPPTRSASI
jgi:hypothetical protein